MMHIYVILLSHDLGMHIMQLCVQKNVITRVADRLNVCKYELWPNVKVK